MIFGKYALSVDNLTYNSPQKYFSYANTDDLSFYHWLYTVQSVSQSVRVNFSNESRELNWMHDLDSELSLVTTLRNWLILGERDFTAAQVLRPTEDPEFDKSLDPDPGFDKRLDPDPGFNKSLDSDQGFGKNSNLDPGWEKKAWIWIRFEKKKLGSGSS